MRLTYIEAQNYSFQFKKEYNLLESMEKGIIPCFSDAKLRDAAAQLVSPGFFGICLWHTVGRGAMRSGTTNLALFNAESNAKWEVSLS